MPRSAVPSLPLLLAAGLLLVNQAPPARSAAKGASLKVAEAAPLAPDTFVVAPHCVPGWIIDASGIRRLPDRCASATEPAANAAAALLLAAPTNPPPRAQLSTARSVSVPPRATRQNTAQGTARKPRAGQACSDPYWFDARGIRRLRPGCL